MLRKPVFWVDMNGSQRDFDRSRLRQVMGRVAILFGELVVRMAMMHWKKERGRYLYTSPKPQKAIADMHMHPYIRNFDTSHLASHPRPVYFSSAASTSASNTPFKYFFSLKIVALTTLITYVPQTTVLVKKNSPFALIFSYTSLLL